MKILPIAAAITSLVMAAISTSAQTVIILSTNDIHGRIDNFGKLAAYVRTLKKTTPDVFVFNAGDLINGNPVVDEAEDKGAPLIDLMNRIPYDLSCLGNHEFENGEANLQRRISQSTSTYVDANVRAVPASAFQTPRPYTFLHTHDGATLGVLGLTASSSNPCLIPNITVADPIKTALQYSTLKDSCDVLIALTHIGYKTDSLLATKMQDFDLIVGGHSHTELPNGLLVNGVLITQAGDKLKFIGKTTLTLKDHHIVKKTFELIDLSKLTATDPAIQKKIASYNADSRFTRVVGETPNGFANKEELGSLKADAIAQQLKLDIAFDHARNVSYSHFPKGNITVGDVYEIDSYDYHIIKYELTPAEIRTLIANSMKKNDEPVLFPSGISYTLKKGTTLKVTLKDKNGPLDEQKRYTVGMNSFIACHFMGDHAPGETLTTTPEECLLDYLKEHPKVDYTGVKRISMDRPYRSGYHATLIRGPYLQVATDNSIIIRWRTDEKDQGIVRYGQSPDALESTVQDTSWVTEHAIKIGSLQPLTKYYYSIAGNELTLQKGSDNTFTTLPQTGDNTHTYRIAAFGDCGNNSVNQRSVRDQFLKHLGAQTLNAWILLGDNSYSYGKDAEYQSNFFNVYKDDLLKKYPLFPSPGNHDYHDEAAESADVQRNGTVAYYRNFSVPAEGEAGGLPSHSQAYYSYNIGNIHFLSLDSHGEENGKRLSDTTSPQVDWVKKDLEANKNKTWVVAYWHHPPYTMGSHNSDNQEELAGIRKNLLPVLERYGVDLILCGHSHDYERSRLMAGHYGPESSFSPEKYNLSSDSSHYVKDATNRGTVYVVAGSAGQLGGKQKTFPHDAMYYSNADIGGMVLLEVTGKQLSLSWICSDGQVRDHFTLLKK
ncbi:MAG TPA: metallophosphoesterase [Puia sp.]